MKIAIVGSGISGLSALWGLSEFSDHEVEIFEKEDRLGGDACSVPFQLPGKEKCEIDLAFLLYNERGWPNYARLIKELKVPVDLGTPSTSFSGDTGRFEWASHSLLTLFGTWTNLANPNVWRMMFDIFRFNYFALDLFHMDPKEAGKLTVGEYLDHEGYSTNFAECYLLPLAASIFSVPMNDIRGEPILTLVQALHLSALLQLTGKPLWHVVKGGSGVYVEAIARKAAPGAIRKSSGVVKVAATESGVDLTLQDGTTMRFDHVIMATHSDTTVSLLKAGECLGTELEKILDETEWTKVRLTAHAWNNTLVHLPEDHPEMAKVPKKAVRTEAPKADWVSCTFNLNLMQPLPIDRYGPVMVTLHPHHPIDPAKIVHSHSFSQPILTHAHVESQNKLDDPDWTALNVPSRISIVGAWRGYGFHEDGMMSSMRTLRDLGVQLPDWINWARIPPVQVTEMDRVVKPLIGMMELIRRESESILDALNWLVLVIWEFIERICHIFGLESIKHDVRWVKSGWASARAPRSRFT